VALADAPPPPPAPVDHDTVTYDFAGEGEGQRRVVELLLRGAGIAFSWDNDGLVVPDASEDAVDELLEELDAYSDTQDQSIAIELGARTLKRVGLVMQYLGGIGLLVSLIEAVSTLDTLADDGFANGGALQKVAFVLGSYTFVLFSALVIGLGGLCRLLAEWVLLRLPDDGREPSRRSEPGP
jgi:hypothetical protein